MVRTIASQPPGPFPTCTPPGVVLSWRNPASSPRRPMDSVAHMPIAMPLLPPPLRLPPLAALWHPRTTISNLARLPSPTHSLSHRARPVCPPPGPPSFDPSHPMLPPPLLITTRRWDPRVIAIWPPSSTRRIWSRPSSSRRRRPVCSHPRRRSPNARARPRPFPSPLATARRSATVSTISSAVGASVWSFWPPSSLLPLLLLLYRCHPSPSRLPPLPLLAVKPRKRRPEKIFPPLKLTTPIPRRSRKTTSLPLSQRSILPHPRSRIVRRWPPSSA
mmetsp:Transcript_26967/g.77775  ORF Transcript_26967/g.77775 Transcript_26967/m.77775 type:complete len:275 (-) Transcript_26967:33-857(-)